MYVYNSDIQSGLPVGYTTPSRLPMAGSFIVIDGLAAALGGAPTADFRLTILADSLAPLGFELDAHVHLSDGASPIGDDFIDTQSSGRALGPNVYTGTLSTDDGMTLEMDLNEPGADDGCLAVFIEVDSGSGFGPLSDLVGLTITDNYGLNPVSNGGAGDQPFYTISAAAPAPPPDFWTSLVGCIQD